MNQNRIEYSSGHRVSAMEDAHKVTVLLADEDSLRRDGLSSVLAANARIEVIAGCADGMTALEEIRRMRPEVAVVDLNLPGLHGIELVRRVRGEGLGTKVIILSGTMDDEIVREVVRAGADAYLLKNGPARHLTDAISYVRDGGQYFSPQLRRDGRDRHLLEEPPRVPPDMGRDSAAADEEPQTDTSYRDTSYRDSDGRLRRDRRTRVRTADRARFQERIRNETSRNLEDRDYEIMAEMADGIRPILDRLDEIEERVMEMEEGEQPVPADPRGWLSAQLSDTLTGGRPAPERSATPVRSRDIEAHLPQLIEEAVNRRFQSMAGKLQEEIEEQHVRTLETFVKNIQVKLVQRVSVLERNMQQQAEAMLQLHDYNQRTEDNLSRLISGVDKLTHELPRRLAGQQPTPEVVVDAPAQARPDAGAKDAGSFAGARESAREKRTQKSSGKNFVPKVFWAVVAVGIAATCVYEYRSFKEQIDAKTPPALGTELRTATAKAAPTPAKPVVPAGDADIKTKLAAAKQYLDGKEYTTAEDIYRQIVEAQPNNEDALRGLASVLYREDKFDESADVLARLPKN